MTDTRSRAPWSAEQVANLQAWQDCGWVHPYTCPNERRSLTPGPDGWTCEECDYRQLWCWAPMLQGPPPDPRELLNG